MLESQIDTRREKKRSLFLQTIPPRNSTIFLSRPWWPGTGSPKNLRTTPICRSTMKPIIPSSKREESKLEEEIIRLIVTGNSDRLRPNSGQPVAIGDYLAFVGCHKQNGSDLVWEWHGYTMRFDNESGFMPECNYGSYVEKKKEEDEKEKKKERIVGKSGLMELIHGVKAAQGLSRVLHRNIDVGSSSATTSAIRWEESGVFA